MMVLMKPLLYAFWKICLLRANPQDLPASRFLLGLSLASYGITGVIDSTVEMPFLQAVLATLVDIALLSALIYIALWMRLLTNRYTQTLTALMGTGAMFGAMAFLPARYHPLECGRHGAYSAPCPVGMDDFRTGDRHDVCIPCHQTHRSFIPHRRLICAFTY